MQRMQRKFGRFLPREADDAQVAALIHDFNEADNMLATLIEASKAWRQAWSDILNRQLAIATEYDTMYQPIEGRTKENNQFEAPSRPPAETPQDTLERTAALKQAYAELKNDMQHELEAMNSRLINPAIEGRDSIQVMKKVIKKREDRKLDYERYKSRVEKLQANAKRSDREETALVKHQMDFERATEMYHVEDDHLKSTLPGVTAAAFAILPHLLNNQILIQNTLLAHFYTALNEYCPNFGLPSRPLEDREIVGEFEATFNPLRSEVESSLQTLRQGKTVFKPMALEEKSKSGTVTGLGIRNGISNRIPSKKSNNALTAAGTSPKPSYQSSPRPWVSITSPPTYEEEEDLIPPPLNTASKPRISSMPSNALMPTSSRTPSMGSPNLSYKEKNSSPNLGSRRPSNPYFAGAPSPGPAASPNLYPVSSRSSAVSIASSYHSANSTPAYSPIGSVAGAAAVAAKKKPPPPPPKPKRLPSQQFEYVTALYDYEGQGEGDLSFREGDKIRVVKKTNSTQDWWDGEMNGLRGQFPANYCQT